MFIALCITCVASVVLCIMLAFELIDRRALDSMLLRELSKRLEPDEVPADSELVKTAEQLKAEVTSTLEKTLGAIADSVSVVPGLTAGKIARSLSAGLTLHGDVTQAIFSARYPVTDTGISAANLMCQEEADGSLTASALGVINMLLLDSGSKHIVVSCWQDAKLIRFDTCLFELDEAGNLSIVSTAKQRPCTDERSKTVKDPQLPEPVDTPEAASVPVDAAAEAAECCNSGECHSNETTPPASTETATETPAA